MISYRILSPGSNITALIYQPVPPDERIGVSNRIMEADPAIEQVGFVTAPQTSTARFSLEMMGDEFCAGAAASAAYDWCRNNDQDKCLFDSSGLSSPITAVREDEIIRLELPRELIVDSQIIPEGRLVDLQGIRFIITENTDLLGEVKVTINKYKKDFIPATTLIYMKKEEEGISIIPWVWVEKTGTLVRESACGSGSIAVAAATDSHQENHSILQPSGAIFIVSLIPGLITLSAPVSYIEDGSIPS